MIPFQVLCTLRYIAKADFFSEVGDTHGVSKSPVSICIPKVCHALCEHLQNITFPSSIMSLRKIKQRFHCIARFPNVVGAIDGTLIPIKGMGGDEEPIYVTRKNLHALNIQGVVDEVCPDTLNVFVQCSPFTNVIHFKMKNNAFLNFIRSNDAVLMFQIS